MKHFIFFYGNHCGACQQIKPLIKRFEKTNNVIWMEDNEENSDIFDKLDIEFLPTMIIVGENEEILEKLSGGRSIEEYINDNDDSGAAWTEH